MTEFEKLRKSLLKKGELYEDIDFACNQSSVFYHETPPFQFVWKRPKDICSNPVFLTETQNNYCNLSAGKLGDHWLTSVMGCLRTTKGLFYRVVPADQSFDDEEYCGMFRFRIWWNGEWKEILVDDRLPTVNNKLIFIHSLHGNQYWPSLLEKAYSKLHGSYEALKYGNSLDGLADLTGGISEPIIIKDTQRLMDVMSKLLSMTSIITAVVQKESSTETNNRSVCEKMANGIVIGNNYRVMAIEKVEPINGDIVQLVRLRNPIGLSNDYIGTWNKDSIEWKSVGEDIKNKFNHKYTIDGEFWMTFNEFIKVFTVLEVIHLDLETSKDEPSLKGHNPWHMKFLRSNWKKGVTAGGCRNNFDTFHINPQIQLFLPETDEIVICLNQHLLLEAKVIGFTLYTSPVKLTLPNNIDNKLDKSFFKKNKSLISSSYINSKYVVLRTTLESGTYVLLPTTYETGQEGQFSLRMQSSKSLKIKQMDYTPAIIKPAISKAPASFDHKFAQYEALFMQFADENKTINAFELQELLETCLPNDYVKSCATLDVCRQIVITLESCGNGRLKYNDYKNIMCSLRNWQNSFKTHTKSTTGILRAEKLHEALNDIGFQLNTEILSSLTLRYMRKDGTLRFGDFVAAILHLVMAFNMFDNKDPVHNGYIKLTLPEFLKVSLQ
ncbi:calpain-C-like [Oppia nitens]|uniref:calpain-C-like n=1 Tax=Oppia nitens TaxID=1686743 RepID=UPI0023DBDBBA|nr:calpain-C-like [Oppia nitens]